MIINDGYQQIRISRADMKGRQGFHDAGVIACTGSLIREINEIHWLQTMQRRQTQYKAPYCRMINLMMASSRSDMTSTRHEYYQQNISMRSESRPNTSHQKGEHIINELETRSMFEYMQTSGQSNMLRCMRLAISFSQGKFWKMRRTLQNSRQFIRQAQRKWKSWSRIKYCDTYSIRIIECMRSERLYLTSIRRLQGFRSTQWM